MSLLPVLTTTSTLTTYDRYFLSSTSVIVNPFKCTLGVSELQFLGHCVSKDRIRPLDEKVKIIRNFPTPSAQHQLREFLGLVNFYHLFIPRCTHILKPLNSLLYATGNELQWTVQATDAIHQLPPSIDFTAMATAQVSDQKLQKLQTTLHP